MCVNSGRFQTGIDPLVRLEMVPKFATVLLLVKTTYVYAYPLVSGQWELTVIPISTDRTRDLGPLQPMPKCLPGSREDWSFPTGSNAPTQTRPRSTHLCHSCSPTLTSPPEISFWTRETDFGSSTFSFLDSIPSGSSIRGCYMHGTGSDAPNGSQSFWLEVTRSNAFFF